MAESELIPKGWLYVEWTRPLRMCSECQSAGHSEGWRNETERDFFLCAKCGPAEIAKKRKPRVVENAEPVPAEAPKRRGRPVGSKNGVRRK